MAPQTLFLDLPTEIVLDVLSLLPYGDLKKRIPLVCRKFHSLLQKPGQDSATEIDKTLCRDSPKPFPQPGKKVCTLHPLLVWTRGWGHPRLLSLDYSYETRTEAIGVTVRGTLSSEPRLARLV